MYKLNVHAVDDDDELNVILQQSGSQWEFFMITDSGSVFEFKWGSGSFCHKIFWLGCLEVGGSDEGHMEEWGSQMEK